MYTSGMYLAVDVGGTKTLLAVFSADGQIVAEEKFVTDKKYNDFLKTLAIKVKRLTSVHPVKACCCALPATELDRKRGIATAYGNLSWTNTPVKKDLADFLPNTELLLENDAKLAGFYEALILKDFKRVLYVTLGTGVGIALIINGVIDTNIGDPGGRGIIMDHMGKLVAWDDLSSGHALAKKYGLKASEIDDPKIWQDYVKDLARGLDILVGITTPDIIVIGGGVGAHFDKFGHFLHEELRKYETDKLPMPPIKKALKPEEAVIYGCYAYIKHHF